MFLDIVEKIGKRFWIVVALGVLGAVAVLLHGP